MSKWQDISTAPRDGRPFLTFSRDAAANPRTGVLGTQSTPVLVMAFCVGDDYPSVVNEDGDWFDINCYHPTHWKPLGEDFPQ